MARYAVLLLGAVTLILAGCVSPYETQTSSAAAGASAPGPLMVRVNLDDGSPTKTLPTNYPDFRPGDRVNILADGTVVPQ